MLIAAWYPELVQKLILGSTACHVLKEGLPVLDNWIHLAEEKRGADLYLDFGKKIYSKALFEQMKSLLEAAGKSVTDAEFQRFVILAKGTYGFDARPELPKIKCPVLVMGSDDDAVLGAEGSREIARLLGCQIYMYKDYGHACYDTAPDYKEKMVKFFAGKQ